ncbi:hypothetical protein HanIR_Chr11g0504731 [Helianthus annuus]|nr:hypothetical protein HanIR_Chr11g0504731 [Helianthus annuus]
MRYKVQTSKPQGPWCTFGKKNWGLNALQSANHRDHDVRLAKNWGLNALQSANHRDHPCIFGKLGTKSKILVNHRDHPCTFTHKIIIPYFFY